jgi:hypothetical protein
MAMHTGTHGPYLGPHPYKGGQCMVTGGQIISNQEYLDGQSSAAKDWSLTAKMGISDMEETLKFFKQHMTMEQRSKFMSEHPVLYKKMFPQVENQTILDHVSERLNNYLRESK